MKMTEFQSYLWSLLGLLLDLDQIGSGQRQGRGKGAIAIELTAGGRGKDTVQKGSNVTDVILQSGHRTVL